VSLLPPGFDWHSSGTTTVTLAALREGLKERNLPVRIAGGKGSCAGVSDIADGIAWDADRLMLVSRLAAKVDNAAVQDGCRLYHQSLIYSSNSWAIVQQGMRTDISFARRYHWHSSCPSMVLEPHAAILGIGGKAADFTSAFSRQIVSDMLETARSRRPSWYEANISSAAGQRHLEDFTLPPLKRLYLPWTLNWKVLRHNFERIFEAQPGSFQELLTLQGVGAKTLFALAAAANLIYGSEPSWKDPVRFSFAVGGKDGIPYPVDTGRMEETAEMLTQAVTSMRLGDREKRVMLSTLSRFFSREYIFH